jgi:hypothetical protein
MEAKDLRIGNLVNYNIVDSLDDRKQWLEESLIDASDLLYLEKHPNDTDFKPIPLTEEWLLRFEFVKKDYGCQIHYYANTKSLWKITFKKDLFKCDKTIIKHVHQLQNLYFALTGVELTLKN